MEQLLSSNSISVVATILATLPGTVEKLTERVKTVQDKLPQDCKVLRRFDVSMIVEYSPTKPIDKSKDWNVRIGILDTESTGLRKGYDEAVELSILILDYSSKDRWEYVESHTWQREPSIPMSVDSRLVTGITDNNLKGKHFPGKKILEVFDNCDYLIAHNAKFDYSMLYSGFEYKLNKYKWLCSLSDIHWKLLGHFNKSLKCLCYDHEIYTDEYHNSRTDCFILGYLLTMECKSSFCCQDEEDSLWEGTEKNAKHTYLDHLIHDNQGITEYIVVHNFPYNEQDLVHGAELTQIGINKWDEKYRCWWICGNKLELENVYGLAISILEKYPDVKLERYELDTVARFFNPVDVLRTILKNKDPIQNHLNFKEEPSSDEYVW